METQPLPEETAEQPEIESTETPADAGVSRSGAEEPQGPEPEGEQPETEEASPEPPRPETDEDQFSRIVRERRARKEGREAEPDPDPDPEPEAGTETGAEAESETEGETESGEADFDKARRPPDTGVQDEVAPEWFQGLPENVRSQLVEQARYSHYLYQSYQALQGRLAPLQRQHADLQRRHDDLQKRLREVEQAPAPTLTDLEESNAYKEIATELPDEAGELKQVFTSQARAAEQAQRRQKELQSALEAERRERIGIETRRLARYHPDWMQITNTPRFNEWRNVVQSNPDMYPEMVQKLNSPFHEDTADVLARFKQDWQQAYPEEFSQVYPQQQQKPASTAKPQQSAERPTQRPKPPNPSPPSQGSGVSGTASRRVPMSDEEAYAAYRRQKKRNER